MSSGDSSSGPRRGSLISKFRRKEDLLPATEELQETFALRRILLRPGKRNEDDCKFIRKFFHDRTTLWREPFWSLLTYQEQLEVSGSTVLRTVPRNRGGPHDFITSATTSGSMVFTVLRGAAQVQCFDAKSTRVDFKLLETFGFVPSPPALMDLATANIEKSAKNAGSMLYRGERDFSERREAVNQAAKIRVKIAPGGQYLCLSGTEVVAMLERLAEKLGRKALMANMGLDFPGIGGDGGPDDEADGKAGVYLEESGEGTRRDAKKREPVMKEARYGAGTVLVKEGEPPTTVFLIVEGECRVIKGMLPSNSSGDGTSARAKGSTYRLGGGKRSKVDMVLTSGFYAQVDVCQLCLIGPKALAGDIPVLLGGTQPASVVASTPLRVLECRADKFANHLDNNVRAKRVYVEAAEARKERIEARGVEIDRLMSLSGTPLLVDMSGRDLRPRNGINVGGITDGIYPGDEGQPVLHQADITAKTRQASRKIPWLESSSGQRNFGARAGTLPANDDHERMETINHTNRSSRSTSSGAVGTNAVVGTRCPRSHVPESERHMLHENREDKASSKSIQQGEPLAEGKCNDEPCANRGKDQECEAQEVEHLEPSVGDEEPQRHTAGEGSQGSTTHENGTTPSEKDVFEVDPSRFTANQKFPLLPCFSSVASQLELGELHSGQRASDNSDNGGGLFGMQRNRSACSSRHSVPTSCASGDGRAPSSAFDLRRRRRVPDGVGSQRAGTCNFDRQGIWTAPASNTRTRRSSGRDGGLGGAVGRFQVHSSATSKMATVAARDCAETLLASHLTPFPTITKNRSLHGVPQPLVRRSRGFADACREDNSRMSATALRAVNRAERDELVTPAERQWILSQIEAGFDTLQHGRRLSHVP